MALEKSTFLGAWGFNENPFILTNADEESRLSSYFVPPPFFDAVLGRPAEPKSVTVFAPRGGGKTAQKVMIEKVANEARDKERFLCLTYDRFVLPGDFEIAKVELDWHLINIVRLLTAALLVTCDEGGGGKLSQHDKDLLVKAARTFLFDINVQEFDSIIGSLRNWRGKTADFVSRYGGQVTNLISAVLARFDMGRIDVVSPEENITKPTVISYFERLIRIARSVGYSSVYILVDRIDETPLTQNDANASFEFLRPLLLDLHVLETEGVAFKFFLWDPIRKLYSGAGGRTDRVPLYALNWTLTEMQAMLSERLSAYSEGQIKKLDQLTAEDVEFSLDRLVCVLAAASPRDMIRLSKAIFDEQTRVRNEPGKISRNTIVRGVQSFSEQRSVELYATSIDELKKIGLASFTISRLANDVLKIHVNAVSRKIQIWTDQGAVIRSGEIPTPGARPRNLYSLADPRLCIATKSLFSADHVLSENIFLCQNCETVNVFEDADNKCISCQSEFSDADTVL